MTSSSHQEVMTVYGSHSFGFFKIIGANLAEGFGGSPLRQ